MIQKLFSIDESHSKCDDMRDAMRIEIIKWKQGKASKKSILSWNLSTLLHGIIMRKLPNTNILIIFIVLVQKQIPKIDWIHFIFGGRKKSFNAQMILFVSYF